MQALQLVVKPLKQSDVTFEFRPAHRIQSLRLECLEYLFVVLLIGSMEHQLIKNSK
jgi:hypothetical protein